MGARFVNEKYKKWVEETHIPQEVKNFLDAICKHIGIDTPEEEVIEIINRGGYVCGYMKGFRFSCCTSSIED